METLWDVYIQVERQIEHQRPDVVVIQKTTSKYLIIDVACPVENKLILKRNKNQKLENSRGREKKNFKCGVSSIKTFLCLKLKWADIEIKNNKLSATIALIKETLFNINNNNNNNDNNNNNNNNDNKNNNNFKISLFI